MSARYSYSLVACTLILAGIVILEVTPLDLWIQDLFFSFSTGKWWVDAQGVMGRVVFYQGPKVLLGFFGCASLALLIGPNRWRAPLLERGWRVGRRDFAIALVTAVLIPVTVGWLKHHSNVYCPNELLRYGGFAPRNLPFMSEVCGQGGHCWPAGHASGGFSLLAFRMVAGRTRQRRAVLIAGLGMGWAMGLYQILKGAHFFSHTLSTLLIALALSAVVETIRRPSPPPFRGMT